jgi:glycosyltransferase involved in cell wall biosynthesis
LDFTNGAATATRDGLRLLAEHGFDCQAFCGTRLDDAQEGLLQESLFRRGVRYEVRKVRIPLRLLPSTTTSQTPSLPAALPPSTAGEASYEVRLLFTVDGNLPVTVFENASTRGGWLNVQEAQAFLTACDIFLRKNRPVSIAVQRLAKRLGIYVLFALHNFSYFDRSAFEHVDCITVPAEFSRRYYREKLGLECRVLPNIVNWKAAQVNKGLGVGDWGLGADGKLKNANLELPERKAAPRQSERGDESPHSKLGYVAFINPIASKGVYVFARIASELARRRPDIPILVTQGRSRADSLMVPELGLAQHIAGQFPAEPVCDGRNITLMPFTPDPRTFYPTVFSMTRLLLMPSLWNESFGLVAAEAMLNGIPVLGSNRGALAETVGGSGTRSARSVPDTLCGQGGFLFEIPAKYTPETREVPPAEEVEPWVETIIRLWDDPAAYERCSRAACERAQQWHPDRLAPVYREFFSRLGH